MGYLANNIDNSNILFKVYYACQDKLFCTHNNTLGNYVRYKVWLAVNSSEYDIIETILKNEIPNIL